jgi:hypothetical protein
MKKITFVLVFILSAYMASAQYEISGIISYANSGSTPMTNCTVYLLSGSDTLAQTISLANGSYSFTNLTPGTYSVIVKTSKPFGGVTGGADALFTLRHFVGIPPLLTGIRLRAADLNGDNHITPVDALINTRRFVNQIPSYRPPYVTPPGSPDWIFDDVLVTITNTSVTANIKSICAGDVGGSYIPAF